LRARRLRLWIALGLTGLGAIILLAIGWLWYAGASEPNVRGVVTGIEARDLGHAGAIMLRTADGRERRFLIEPSVDPQWTPGHLRDHMTFAEAVTVYYQERDGQLFAYRITD
jgi:hypothetical protein